MPPQLPNPQPSPPLNCKFCPHPEHTGKRCAVCKCKGKRHWLDGLLSSIGNAIGEAKFGGN